VIVDFIVGFNTNPFNDTREGLLEKKVNKKVLKKWVIYGFVVQHQPVFIFTHTVYAFEE